MSHPRIASPFMRAIGLTAALTACSSAWSASSVVPGNANPNLAGRDAGYTCCAGDGAPGQSPVLVSGLSLHAGDVLAFQVTGQVSHGGGPISGNNPDGQVYGGVPSHFGDGIASPVGVNRINALMGLFLGDTSPTGAATPAQIDHGGAYGDAPAFVTVAPLIGQIFFIGNGLTGDTMKGDFGGTVQTFTVPVGATRLFLGTSDGYGWYNNTGHFDVQITSVPEPDAIIMLMAGAGLAWQARRRGPRAKTR